MTTVFFDIDTQNDFMLPSGALYVPGAEAILPMIARLNRYAVHHGIIVVSTTDAHDENDPEFRQWPPHCVAGTIGQQKPAETLLERRAVIPTTPGVYEIDGAQQIIVQKQALDLFTNPNLPALLERASRYVVYGVVTEYCVRCAVLGLLKTGKPVEMVTDAIRTLKDDDGRRTIEEFTAAGGVLTTAERVCAG
ncbi:MAG TPA: isochorismatase family protein [Bryobacteraceae bacterium]|nr:isochorismatase family protein [Bryobacteraceae bacterium]